MAKRKHPPSERQVWMKKKAAELVKRNEPPMSIACARFYARMLWDRR